MRSAALLVIAMLTSCRSGEVATPGALMHEIPGGIEVAFGSARVRVTALSPTVLRVRYAGDGRFGPDRSYAVVAGGFTDPVETRVITSSDGWMLDAGAVKARVKPTLEVAFVDASGAMISQDARPLRVDGQAFQIAKAMAHDEHYYGLGDKPGPLDRRGRAFTIWTSDAWKWQEASDPLYKAIPFVLALRRAGSYGYFLDNTYRGFFDFGTAASDVLAFGAEGGAVDYYFFYGPSPKAVLDGYTRLTGRMPLPPLFALGYQQSRQNYNTEQRYRELAAEFRKRSIPADVLWLDGGYTIGDRSFTVDRARFPTFEAMIKDLGAQGFRFVISAYFTIETVPGDRAYDEGIAGGHFVHRPDGKVHVGKSWPGDTVYPDFARATTRRWWGDQYDAFLRAGIRGVWDDMNEPAVENGDLPGDTVYDADGRKADHRELHNVYGHLENQAVYEGMLRHAPDHRPLILTRAGFAGTQRYAATWTGDNTESWNHMRISIPQLASLGLSGFAFAGADIGGFIPTTAGSSPELITRWMQLAAFTPFFRNHASEVSGAREPWVDGPMHEAVRRAAIETRYRLLPYIYTAMDEASRTGTPVMRPMFLEFPDEPTLATMAEQFMFGPALLVAPRVWDAPGAYAVTLPRGIWFDYWTGERMEGGRTINVDPPLATIPVYARAGSIIAEQPVVQHTGQVPAGPLELRVYPGPSCAGALYADDGDTFAYQRGELLRVRFSCEDLGDRVRVVLPKPDTPYHPWFTRVRVIIYAPRPREVRADGKHLDGWTSERGAVTVPELAWPGEAHDIELVK